MPCSVCPNLPEIPTKTREGSYTTIILPLNVEPLTSIMSIPSPSGSMAGSACAAFSLSAGAGICTSVVSVMSVVSFMAFCAAISSTCAFERNISGTHFIALVSRQEITKMLRAVSDGPFSITNTTPKSPASIVSSIVMNTSRMRLITHPAALFFFLNRGGYFFPAAVFSVIATPFTLRIPSRAECRSL